MTALKVFFLIAIGIIFFSVLLYSLFFNEASLIQRIGVFMLALGCVSNANMVMNDYFCEKSVAATILGGILFFLALLIDDGVKRRAN